MASNSYQCDDLHHIFYQPLIEPERRYPTPRFVQVEVTITLQLGVIRHYCLIDQFTYLEDTEPLQETLRFDLRVLKNHDLAYQILAPMLRSLGVNPSSPVFNAVIDDIVQHGQRIESSMSDMGSEVLPLYVDLSGTLVQHVNQDEEYEEEIERALEESTSEFETGNYNMVPAKASSVKKMLKRVRVEAGEFDQRGGENIKKRRVKGDDCVICMEELKVGSDASQMPCSHTFHGDYIEKWLKQSHYGPVCPFEMPI